MVSVIVPIYNVEPYLRDCVDSLLAQDFTDLEIILVDDGSPDGCPAIANEYAEKYDHVTCYHKPNGGLGDARNYGVTRAKGEWVAFVDSDDDVSPTYISDLVKLREQFGADMAITKTRRIEPGEVLSRQNAFPNYCISGKETLWKVYGERTLGWSAYGKLIPREMSLKYPFARGYYEDCACMYRILYEMESVAIGDYRSNYHYYKREGSILMSPFKPEHMRIYEICDEFSSFMAERSAQAQLLDVLLRRAAATQILRCQRMDRNQYRSIFCADRALFRKTMFQIMEIPSLPPRIKADFFLHCTTPGIYRLSGRLMRKG